MPDTPTPAPVAAAKGPLDYLIALALVGLLAVQVYDRARPAPAPQEVTPAVVAAARAYIVGEPVALRSVAAQVRDGKATKDTLASAVVVARTATAKALAAAIESAADPAAALDAAAAAMEARLK